MQRPRATSGTLSARRPEPTATWRPQAPNPPPEHSGQCHSARRHAVHELTSHSPGRAPTSVYSRYPTDTAFVLAGRQRLGMARAGSDPEASHENAAPERPRREAWIEDFGLAHEGREVESFDGTVTPYRMVRHPQWWRTGDEKFGWDRYCWSVDVVYLAERDHHRWLLERRVRELAASIERGQAPPPGPAADGPDQRSQPSPAIGAQEG